MTPTKELLRRDAAYDRWGEAGAGGELGAAAEEMLRERIGLGEPRDSVPLGSVEVPPATVLPDPVIAACGGEDAISIDDGDRIRHAAGKGYPDLIRMRTREGMAVAKAKGRLKGKQPKLSAAQRRYLLQLAGQGDHTQAQLAELFNVSRTTIYRELQRAGA